MRIAGSWISAVGLVAVCVGSAAAGANYVPYTPQVVLISIDGLRPDVINDANTPNLMALSRRGSSTFKAQTSTIPQTLPNHASMLSGVTPAVHKMTWDTYNPSKPNIAVPTILSAAKAQAMTTVAVVGKDKFLHLVPSDAILVMVTRGDDQVANEAIVRALLPFDLLFVHFPDVDLTGHARGWMSPEYLNQVKVTDRALGRLLSAIPLGATILFTADHGGKGIDHAEICTEDTSIPWFIAGPNVAPRHDLVSPVNTVDTAATVASVLGLTLPSSISGHAITEALIPYNDPGPDVFQTPDGYLRTH